MLSYLIDKLTIWAIRRKNERRFSVVCALALGPAYATDIVAHSKECDVGAPLSRRSIFVTLARMEELGMVRARWVPQPDGAPDRRLYKLTPFGMAWFNTTFKPMPIPTAHVHRDGDEGN